MKFEVLGNNFFESFRSEVERFLSLEHVLSDRSDRSDCVVTVVTA